MKVSLGADHKGYTMKEEVKKCLDSLGIEYIDNGTFSEESVDYPDYAFKVGRDINEGRAQTGIVICQTGIGMSIAANKVKNIRAAYVINSETASAARHHNNANVMALGAAIIDKNELCSIVKTFITEEFDGGRHERRIDKISACDI